MREGEADARVPPNMETCGEEEEEADTVRQDEISCQDTLILHDR